MIPDNLTFITDKDGETKVTWDSASAKKAIKWAEGKGWDYTNKCPIKNPYTKITIKNDEFELIDIGEHTYSSKGSWFKIKLWYPNQSPIGEFTIQLKTDALMRAIRSIGVGGYLKTDSLTMAGKFRFVIIDGQISILDTGSIEYKALVAGATAKNFQDSFPMKNLQVGGFYRSTLGSRSVMVYCGQYFNLQKKWGHNPLKANAYESYSKTSKVYTFIDLILPDPCLDETAEVESQLQNYIALGPKNTQTYDFRLQFVTSSRVIRHHVGNIDHNLLRAAILIHKTGQTHFAQSRINSVNPNNYQSSFPALSRALEYNVDSVSLSETLPIKLTKDLKPAVDEFIANHDRKGSQNAEIVYTNQVEL